MEILIPKWHGRGIVVTSQPKPAFIQVKIFGHPTKQLKSSCWQRPRLPQQIADVNYFVLCYRMVNVDYISLLKTTKRSVVLELNQEQTQ